MADTPLTDNPYLLLTPGPLTTTPTVKEVMLKDWCTWDRDYNQIVQSIRKRLVSLATNSSANKCIQGVPGFGFTIARTSVLQAIQGNARSLSLDLYDQWKTMEAHSGKWRFTSPTHTVRAFSQAITELDQEGGITRRFARYSENHRILVSGMAQLGFKTILKPEDQSPIITAFYSPTHPDYSFDKFYSILKTKGFVIYPGKVTELNTLRIGNIGDSVPAQMERLINCIKEAMYWI